MATGRSYWHSLQSRLMTISMAATVTVLGGAGGVATWRLHQELLASTKHLHEEVGQQFIQDVTTYQEMYTAPEAIERAIEKYTQPDLLWHVADEDGSTLAESSALLDRNPIASPASSVPELVKEDGRTLVLCGLPLELASGDVVQIRSISDVTDAYRAYNAFVQTLVVAGSGAVLIATVGGLVLIRRSLRPLHNISHVAATVSVEQLEEAELALDNSPTEVEQLAEAFNAMLQRLAAAWTQEQQLLSNISHELRTPLAIVQGYLESTLRRGSNLTEIQMESLAVSLEETQRVVRLLKDLMDLTRAEAGAFHLKMEGLNLNDFLQDVEMIAGQLGPNPITLDYPDEPVRIRADRDRLKQVMLNLVTNAIRYSDPSGQIALRLFVRDDTAVIQVRDEGIGIPAEHQPHIFERFYCVSHSRSRKEGGIGLGLAVTRTLVENMRGKISVESELGVGSTFTVEFPICTVRTDVIGSLRSMAGVEG